MACSASFFGAATNAPKTADHLARLAAQLLVDEGCDALGVFDAFPGPLYATDAVGELVYFNPACSTLAGKHPTKAHRWCVCDEVRDSNGTLIDPEQGPNALAVRSATPIRGIDAIVERPDGVRIAVRPHPTPAIDRDGRAVGLVSVIVPLDGQLHRDLLATALRCKTLAKWIGDPQASKALAEMAIECEQHAEVLRPA